MSSSPDDPRLTGFARVRRPPSRATVSAEIMVAAIVFFVMTVAFVIFLYLYARYRWGPGSADRRARERRMRRGGHHGDRARPRRLPKGLDPAVLEALPVRVYKREEFTEDGGVECAVCLTELADGEKVRMLRKCNHGFHVDCIDMWFASHSTCPLCRDPVGKKLPEEKREQEEEEGELEEDEDMEETETQDATTTVTISDEQYSTEPPPNFPTNVLFWGSQDRVSTATPPTAPEPEPARVASSAAGSSGFFPGKPQGALVIDIPARVVEGLPSSSSSSSPTSLRSGWAATPTRLRSFRRLFSREKRVAAAPGCSCEGGAGDIEQGCSAVGGGGVVISTTPKTPPPFRVTTPKTPTRTAS